MIFYVFYSNFSLHDSLENVFSEHSEWLKFQKFSKGSASRPLSCIAHCLRQYDPLDEAYIDAVRGLM